MRNTSSSSVRVFYRTHSREEIVTALTEAVGDLARALPLRRVVLFGSTAANRHDVGSDVDVLVIYEDPARDDAYAVVKKSVDVPRVEPHAYSASQYEGVRAVVDSMVRDGIEIELPQDDR